MFTLNHKIREDKILDDLPITILLLLIGTFSIIVSVNSYLHHDLTGFSVMGVIGIINLIYFNRIRRNLL